MLFCNPSVLKLVETCHTYLAKALAAFLAWTSLLMRMVSRLTGLGMKPTTPSSFTGRPIHHSLLNFCSFNTNKQKKKEIKGLIHGSGSHLFLCSKSTSVWFSIVCVRDCVSNLFDMEELSGLEGDGLARYRNVVVVCWRVREVATYSECHRLGLGTQDIN